MKNKKVILGVIVAIILLIIIIAIIVNRSDESTEERTIMEDVDISQVFEIENVENTEIAISKNNDVTVAPKYSVGNNTYVIDANVNFNERTGKVIFLRNGENANIFQTSYKIDEEDSISTQVGGYMQTFIDMCTSYMGVSTDEEAYSTILYGEDTTTAPIPVEESIYLENRLYSLTYRVEDNMYADMNLSPSDIEETTKEYDINFYRVDNNLVCEFVNLL